MDKGGLELAVGVVEVDVVEGSFGQDSLMGQRRRQNECLTNQSIIAQILGSQGMCIHYLGRITSEQWGYVPSPPEGPLRPAGHIFGG